MAQRRPTSKSKNAPSQMRDNGTPSLTPTPDSAAVPHKSQTPDPRGPKTTNPNQPSPKKQRGAVQLPQSSDVWSETPTHSPLSQGPLPNSAITPYRVWMHKLIRFQPIAQVTPENVTRQLDMWYAGTLRYFALMQDAVARRDDVLQSVIPKRKAALARREFQILPDEDADPIEAAKHQCVLNYFYKNIQSTHAVDMNQRRGIKLLIENILDAKMMKYAIHEILWKPTADMVDLAYTDQDTGETEVFGTVPGLTATMNFVPVWFFENRTGKLRFLQEDFSYDGVDMEDGAWLTAVGDGVMEAAVVAYMFKKLAMQEWLTYMQRQATPGIVGKVVGGTPGTDRWEGMQQAVQDFASGFGMVINAEDSMDPLDMGATGQLPFPAMIERMDRVLATLMRGQDLSTMSAHHTSGGAGGGQGASLQGDEEHIVETDDANFVNETLQLNLDPWIIAYYFGEGTKPLARATVVVPEEKDKAGILEELTFLVDSGVKIGKRYATQQLGYEMCSKDDEPLEKPTPAPSLALPNGPVGKMNPTGNAANEAAKAADKALIEKSDELFQAATYKALQPLVDRLLGVMELPDDAQDYGLHRLLEDMPAITRQINANPENAKVLKDALSGAWFNSIIASAVEHHSNTRPATAVNEKDALGHGSNKRSETYHKGDRAEYTGKKNADGMHELEIMEGSRKGQMVYTARGPNGEDPYVTRNQKEWQEQQAQFRKLRET